LEIERGDGGAGLVKLDEESVCRVLFFFFFLRRGFGTEVTEMSFLD
jgi:hypothetical protein